jgi:hypothetical protein
MPPNPHTPTESPPCHHHHHHYHSVIIIITAAITLTTTTTTTIIIIIIIMTLLFLTSQAVASWPALLGVGAQVLAAQAPRRDSRARHRHHPQRHIGNAPLL